MNGFLPLESLHGPMKKESRDGRTDVTREQYIRSLVAKGWTAVSSCGLKGSEQLYNSLFNSCSQIFSSKKFVITLTETNLILLNPLKQVFIVDLQGKHSWKKQYIFMIPRKWKEKRNYWKSWEILEWQMWAYQKIVT